MEHGRKHIYNNNTKKKYYSSRFIIFFPYVLFFGMNSPPPVEATIGDTLVINTHNSLDEPTALHTHGMFQNNTGYMDGPSMVTQW